MTEIYKNGKAKKTESGRSKNKKRLGTILNVVTSRVAQGGEKDQRYSKKKIDGLSAGKSYDSIPVFKEKRYSTKHDMEHFEKRRP